MAFLLISCNYFFLFHSLLFYSFTITRKKEKNDQLNRYTNNLRARGISQRPLVPNENYHTLPLYRSGNYSTHPRPCSLWCFTAVKYSSLRFIMINYWSCTTQFCMTCVNVSNYENTNIVSVCLFAFYKLSKSSLFWLTLTYQP